MKKINSIEELKEICPVIAVVKYSFFIDHYVTVLEVTDDKITIGDPLTGQEELTYEEFKNKWCSVGIVVQKK